MECYAGDYLHTSCFCVLDLLCVTIYILVIHNTSIQFEINLAIIRTAEVTFKHYFWSYQFFYLKGFSPSPHNMFSSEVEKPSGNNRQTSLDGCFSELQNQKCYIRNDRAFWAGKKLKYTFISPALFHNCFSLSHFAPPPPPPPTEK